MKSTRPAYSEDTDETSSSLMSPWVEGGTVPGKVSKSTISVSTIEAGRDKRAERRRAIRATQNMIIDKE